MDTPRSSEAGSVLVYAMLTMAAMLAIGLTLTGLFIAKLKSAAAARDSTVAIYIADSVAEKCLYEARQQADYTELTFAQYSASEYEYKIFNASSSDPQGDDVTLDGCKAMGAWNTFRFRATGTYRGVSRTLEIWQ